MKKWTRWALALGFCLVWMIGGALAAEGGISVQLDGRDLAFTDAAPQVKDQRTFLPFRAVFEAMGADVDYEGNKITAVRGDKTLTMTIGSTQATVTEGERVTHITMDVAPYVDNSVYRTYVPVRFAAQSFDCAVGWDQTAQTAVIVDTEKLAAEAMEGKTYTLLKKIAAMSEKYKDGLWDVDAAFEARMAVLSMPMMTMNGTVEATMAGAAQGDMTMRMKLDMDAALRLAGTVSGQSLPEETRAMLETLKTNGAGVALRGDVNAGKLYMNMDLGALGTQAGLEADAWYEIDQAPTERRMDAMPSWEALLTGGVEQGLVDGLVASLSAQEPNDAANGYTQLKKAVTTALFAFSDQGFQAGEEGFFSNYYSYPLAGGGTVTISLSPQLKGEEVVDYALELSLTTDEDTDTPLVASVFYHMNADGTFNSQIDMDRGGRGYVTMTISLDGRYAPGTAAPVVTPPVGAKIVPFTDLAGRTVDLGVIGGPDGPTVVIQ